MKKNILLLLFLCNSIFSSAQIKINELMASNATTITDNAGGYSDWLELYNPTASAIDLAGYYITDNFSNKTKFQFTTTLGQVVVPANGYLIIWASGEVTRGPKHTSFSLSADGEALALVLPDGLTIVDSLSFGPQWRDVSYGREPNGSATFKYFSPASPGSVNLTANAYTGLAASPVFSAESGFYPSAFSLTISSTEPEATIYYTTDGSDPSSGNLAGTNYYYKNQYPELVGQTAGPSYTNTYRSYQYNGTPISIINRNSPVQPNVVSNISTTIKYSYTPPQADSVFKGTTVRARVYVPGKLPSEIISKIYFFTPAGLPKYTVPVISIQTTPSRLFDYTDGIYVAGKDFVDYRNGTNTSGTEKNYNRSTEIPVNFEILDTNGVKFSQNVGLRIHGSGSRDLDKKSLRFYASGAYGAPEYNYPLVPTLPFTNFKRFMMKTSGNDYERTLFKDASISQMAEGLNFENQQSRPSVMFINGEYWGIHHITERLDEYHYANHFNIDADSIEYYSGFNDNNVPEIEDDSGHWGVTLNFMKNNAMSNTANYDYIKERIDVESFIDYTAMELYAANWDWPIGNITYWRYKTPYSPTKPKGKDGRWRWALYDTDLSFEEYNENYFTKFDNPNTADYPYKYLIENTEFKNQFITRYADLINTQFQPTRLLEIINAKKNVIDAEIRGNITRWQRPSTYANWQGFVNLMTTFATLRPPIVRGHIQSRFSLSGQYDLTVNVSNPDHGYVRVNTIDVLPTTPGVSASPYPWTGKYFYQSDNSLPVVIRARPKLGYKFKHWVYNATILTDSVQIITATSARSYTAVFESAILSDNPVPTAALLEACGYSFTAWDSTSAAGTTPNNMKFVYMAEGDPGVSSAIAGYTNGAYNLTSSTRINGRNSRGFSFINTGGGNNAGYPATGSGGQLGGAILAINTQNKDEVTVKWKGRTRATGTREYALRLQYRIGDQVNFTDLLNESNQIIEYNRGAVGDSAVFEVKLPVSLLNQPYIQLLWRYYRKAGTSGGRDELGVDDIFVESKRVLSGTTVAGVSTENDGALFSTASVVSSSQVLYEAKRFIELNPGFNTSQGAVFQAQIKGCP
jgi:hypothetical protein